jgi:predicted Rossmann-fold nucleotide-binding protein
VAEERFITQEHRQMMISERDPEDLLDRMAGYRPPATDKWLDRETS